MRRSLLNLLTALSLLLCVAVCGLWVRSYSVQDVIQYVTAQGWQIAASSQGRIGCAFERGALADEDVLVNPLAWSTESPSEISASGAGVPTFDTLGFSLARVPGYSSGHTTTFVTVPHWSIALLGMILPVWRWGGRGRKVRPGHCPRCGYDLRATPGRCPECGMAAAPAAPSR